MELLGLLVPVVIDLINRKIVDSDIRFWVSVLVCVVVGAGINFLTTSFSFPTPLAGFESITKSVMVVFGLAQLSYKAIYENSGIRDKMGFNAKTN